MKKIFNIFIFLFFISTTPNYAQFFKGQPETDNYSSNSNSENSGEATYEDYSGFFRNSSAVGPGDRPGSGDGIGQEAPLVDGLAFLIACCGILIVVKTVREKQKKIPATEVFS